MEFTSAKTYARVEKNLDKAEEFGLIALEKNTENSYIPYFLAKEVFMQQKKRTKAGEMFIEALNRPDTQIQKSFKIGDKWYRTVHEAVSVFDDDFYNYGIEEYNKGNIEKSFEYFDFTLKFNDGHIETLIMLSEIYYKDKNDINEAIRYIDIAMNKIDDDEASTKLSTVKTTYLRKSGKYEEALLVLSNLGDKLDLYGRIELFMLYIDMEKLDDAIDLGSSLILEMEDTLPFDQSGMISDAAYNLAICYRMKGEAFYNKTIYYIRQEAIDGQIYEKNTNNDSLFLEVCDSAIANFSLAKENFELSYDYDDSSSPITKENRKEMRKLIKNIENEIIPALDNSNGE